MSPLLPLLLAHSALAADHVVAVAPFDANTAETELQPLGLGLSDMLITDLSRAEGLTLVEREHLNAVVDELSFQQSELVDPAGAAELGRALGAELIVVGALTTHDDIMRLDARAIEVETGTVRYAADVEGRTDAFFKLEGRLARKLAEGLDGRLPDAAVARLASPRATSTGAAVTYSEALAAYDEGDFEEAEQGAREAAAEDPGLRAASDLALQARAKGMAGFGFGWSALFAEGNMAQNVSFSGHLWLSDRFAAFGRVHTPWLGEASGTSWSRIPLSVGLRGKIYEELRAGSYVHYSPRATVLIDPTFVQNPADGGADARLGLGWLLGYDIEIFVLEGSPHALNISVSGGQQARHWHPGFTSPFTMQINTGFIFYLWSARG